MHRRPLLLASALLSAAVLVAGCGDDGDVLSGGSATSTTRPASSTSVGTTSSAVPATRFPGKAGQPPLTTVLTGTRVDPPQPTTTPNVTQPADSLLDGQHVAFMVDVLVDARTVDLDVVQWILRADFPAAIAEGRLSAGDSCTELDYCIANAQDRVRTLTVTPDARVSLVDYDACCGSVRTDSLGDVFTRMREGRDLFVVTVANGQITAIDEMYLA